MNINEVAKKINWPLEKWPGNCYGLALMFVQNGIVEGVARYGHYLGEIHPKSMFYRSSTPGFVQHGWVELSNGNIVDPTRYVMEGKEPYIYEGPADHYDIGGSSIRDMMREQKGPPPFIPSQTMFSFDNLPESVIKLLHLICEDNREENKFSLDQMFWLGNANPKQLGRYAFPIYKEFERLKQDAFIPFDYWTLIVNDK